jgi:hypothetical protein
MSSSNRISFLDTSNGEYSIVGGYVAVVSLLVCRHGTAIRMNRFPLSESRLKWRLLSLVMYAEYWDRNTELTMGEKFDAKAFI